MLTHERNPYGTWHITNKLLLQVIEALAGNNCRGRCGIFETRSHDINRVLPYTCTKHDDVDSCNQISKFSPSLNINSQIYKGFSKLASKLMSNNTQCTYNFIFRQWRPDWPFLFVRGPHVNVYTVCLDGGTVRNAKVLRRLMPSHAL